MFDSEELASLVFMEFNLFISTFALIFVAELPDKTAFAALFLATCHNPFAVFLGASLAFVIQSLVAVAFGSLLSLLPPHFIHLTAGLLFLIFAFLMWRRPLPENAVDSVDHKITTSFSKSFSMAFMTIFIAEWGDLTQLATATLSAKYHSPLTIFTSATLALWAVTALSVIVGSHLKHRVRPKVLQTVASSAFAIVGFLFLIKA